MVKWYIVCNHNAGPTHSIEFLLKFFQLLSALLALLSGDLLLLLEAFNLLQEVVPLLFQMVYYFTIFHQL